MHFFLAEYDCSPILVICPELDFIKDCAKTAIRKVQEPVQYRQFTAPPRSGPGIETEMSSKPAASNL
jgi:hypothetical protein